MRIAEALSKIDLKHIKLNNPMFNICFSDCAKGDCTQFTIERPGNVEEIENNLTECWEGFCMENGLDEGCVEYVIYVGDDPDVPDDNQIQKEMNIA